jgi:hypothetical protein
VTTLTRTFALPLSVNAVATQTQKEIEKLMGENGISAFHPVLTFAGAFSQLPVWMTFFFTIQVM